MCVGCGRGGWERVARMAEVVMRSEGSEVVVVLVMLVPMVLTQFESGSMAQQHNAPARLTLEAQAQRTAPMHI